MKNEFFDINRLPKQAGLLIFGISISKIDNVQKAKKCFEYIDKFYENKIVKPIVGLNFIYSDNLSLYSDEKASTLKKKHQASIHNHKYGFIKILEKNSHYIPNAFNYTSWGQIILESKQFLSYFEKLKKIYRKDEEFKKIVKKDINLNDKKVSQNQINFILEEILMFYLVSKGKVRLNNEYVQDKQKWILWCYPGKPLLSEIYLFQKNFFKLSNPENVYENSYYDLIDNKLYDYTKIDLEDFEV